MSILKVKWSIKESGTTEYDLDNFDSTEEEWNKLSREEKEEIVEMALYEDEDLFDGARIKIDSIEVKQWEH